MPEQISLFSGSLAPFSPSEEPAPKTRRRATAPSFTPESQPAKYGPPNRLFGTSSWTYPGWNGTVYQDVAAYGAATRFNELALTEYARDPRPALPLCRGRQHVLHAAVAPAAAAEKVRRAAE